MNAFEYSKNYQYKNIYFWEGSFEKVEGLGSCVCRGLIGFSYVGQLKKPGVLFLRSAKGDSAAIYSLK
jgi:hypothetical protein